MTTRSERLALAAILMLAAGLRLWNLTGNGFGNLYYAAVARSMMESWHNFLYASYDPVGFLTSEKPPLASGLQALAAKLMGYHSLSILVPSVIAGLVTIWAVYSLVRRAAGPPAGQLAALVAALTPISVVMDRHNAPDSIMAALLTCGALFLLRAADAGRLTPLLLSMACVGLAFNTKMLQALIPVPAFFLVYLLGAPLPWRKRITHLSAAGALLVACCLAWPLFFDLTPAEKRPFAAGSEDGSVRSLILGWNGLDRLTGRIRDEFAQPPLGAPGKSMGAGKGMNAGGNQGPPLDSGRPGLLRLAVPHVAAQVAWLLPFTLAGSALAFFRRRLTLPLDAEQHCILLCAGWALTFMAVFSLSRGVIHTYYTVEMAPPLAALTGISAVHLRRLAEAPGWRRLVLPVVLVMAAAWQIHILSGSPHWRVPLAIAMLAGIIAAILLTWQRRLLAATATGLVALLLCPGAWSWTAVGRPAHPGLPAAGPDPRLEPRRADEFERGGIDARALVNFLRTRAAGERILLAATSAQITNGIIVDTGAPVIAMGGFLGTDRAMSLERLRSLIASRELRFILIAPFDRIAGDRERTEWVRQNCDIVPARLWRDEGSRPRAPVVQRLAGPEALVQLFDCAAE